MSPSREFNAGNVDKAVARAASDLNLPESDVTYEVLDAGSEGFLGIGARDARILVTLPHSDDFAQDDDPLASEPVSAESQQETDDSSYGSRASETPVEPDNDNVQDNLEAEFLQDEDSVNTGAGDDDLPEASPETMEEIRTHVESIVSAMDIRSRVDVYDVGDHIAVDITSDHTALLIGQKGETIDALQHLINSATFRRASASKRVILDSEGYRQRRIEALQGMAHRSARKAQREDREIKMPSMSSAERRVIHLYLEGNPDVSTYSEGRGNDRRVVISPE